MYPGAANASIFKAFHNFANNAPEDPDTAVILTIAYREGQYVAANFYEYAKPVVNPPILHEFMEIENTMSTMRVASLPELVLELYVLNSTQTR